MKFQKTLLASATTAALAAAGSAQAVSLGEYWAVDQIAGVAHIFDQACLNDATCDANVADGTETQVDLAASGDYNSVRMHILGFSNHGGMDPASRTILTYLGGWMEIWKTNGGTGAPTEVAEMQASTTAAYSNDDVGPPGGIVPAAGPDKGNTSHACGGNPQNDQIQCASIFNGDFTLFEADMTTDSYSRIGIFRTGELTVSNKLNSDMALKGTVQAAFDAMLAIDSNPNNICSQYSTDGNLLYIAAQTSTTTGGVIVVDVSNPRQPAILDAYNDVMAAGCGLVNHPDGEHLWITHGFNKHNDPEEVSIWSYANAGVSNGPVDRVALPTDDSQAVYGGDAHGAQFAGIASSYMWQVMRIDDKVQIIDASSGAGPGTGEPIGEIDLEDATGRTNVQPDVIDRSALGTNMYWTTRGPRPTSAIGTSSPTANLNNRYNHEDRLAGVDVFATLYGDTGVYLKNEDMSAGKGTVNLCKPEKIQGVDQSAYLVWDREGTCKKPIEVTAADPHGSKSLNYLTGF
jgi:hypothetical protein